MPGTLATPRPLAPWASWCHAALLFAVAIALAAQAVLWGVAGGWSLLITWAALPHPWMLLAIAVFLAAAASGGEGRRAAHRAAACLGLLAFWVGFRVLTMGDGHRWREDTAAGIASYAEPLSSMLHGAVFQVFGRGANEWLAPALGVAATWAWLATTDLLLAAVPVARRRTARLVAAVIWAGSGVLLLFAHRFVEQTQLGIPFSLLGLGRLTVWTRAVTAPAGGAAPHKRDFLGGTLLLALAALSHLGYLTLLLAAAGGALFARSRAGAGAMLRQVATTAALVALPAIATLVLLWFGPFATIPGSVAGGADGRWLVAPAALLTLDHHRLVAFAVLYAVPSAPLFAAGVLAGFARAAHLLARDAALVAAAAAWLAFVSLYGFDLGWPYDADLMIAMSPALALLVAVWLAPAAASWSHLGRIALGGALLAGAAVSWSVTARLVRPTWQNLSQRNSELGSLLVDGMSDGEPPYRLAVAPGEPVTLHAAGPAGARFWVLAGEPSPACEGHPYGGVADIALGNSLDPRSFVHAGQFDAEGRATITWTATPLPDGTWPGLQLLVFGDFNPSGSTTSAAIYFTPH